jgi:predicted nucleic acid-binding protein
VTRGLLDTSVFIARKGRGLDVARLPDEVAVSVITYAELRAGVLAASDLSVRSRRLSTLQTVAGLNPLPIDASVADAWAELRLRSRRVGQADERQRHLDRGHRARPRRSGRQPGHRLRRPRRPRQTPRRPRLTRSCQRAAVASTRDAAALDELVRSFSGADRVETSAALLAIATITVDPDLRRRVRREIAERGHVLPRWLAELDRTEPVDRAVEISTVFRDADELLVGVTVPGGHPLTAVVRIDNELGAVATDGYVVQSPLASVVPLLVEDDDPDVRVRDIPPADARARITHAVEELHLGPAPFVSETWAESRPLVEWMLSLLPEGGRDDVLRELSEEELDEIAGRFLDGGGPWSDDELRPLLDAVLVAGSANGIGDPLAWSPRATSVTCSTRGAGASTPRRRTSTAHRTCSAT